MSFLIFRYRDTGYPTCGMGGRWSSLWGHVRVQIKELSKIVGQIMGYWSSSSYAANATNAWNVNFNNGNDNANNKSNNNYVRLVRGGEWIA
jgi:hypothetical protein